MAVDLKVYCYGFQSVEETVVIFSVLFSPLAEQKTLYIVIGWARCMFGWAEATRVPRYRWPRPQHEGHVEM